MTTYQDVVQANGALGAWALTEAAGGVFAPYLGGTSLTGGGVTGYRDPGPFAGSFGLRVGVGGNLRLPFATVVQPPVTNEAWFKLSTFPPAPYAYLLRAGTLGSSGNGFYVDPAARHVFYTAPVTGPIDTGFVWPDLNWHLVDWSSSAGNVLSLYVDGQIVWRVAVGSPGPPTPNVLGYGCDGNADNEKQVTTIAWPAFYPFELAPTSVTASFLAATNPSLALAYAFTGGGQIGQSNSALLDLIYAAVHKVYPAT